MKKHGIIVWLFFMLPSLLIGQEEPKNYVLSGYIKDLQSLFIINNPDPVPDLLFQDNLIHNRLNFKWYINDNFTLRAEARNRIFWGDQIRFSGGETFLEQIDQANDFFDLSFGKADDRGLAFHTMIDRLYMDWTKGNWEIRLGRQRINWGISTVWNPNDVFNAFSFTDFDYEERPGSDVLRIKYYTGVTSSIEIAVKAFNDIDTLTAAALWKFNKWNYDFQLLSGVVNRDFVLGAGWAGNIKNAGFKGEFSWFRSLEGTEDSFAATFGIDYSFSNSIYLSGGFLFNSNGTIDGNITTLFSFELSAKNLYPYKYALFSQVNYPISPLLTGGMAIIYSPVQAHALFINPVLTYSIKENWDLDFIGQLVFNRNDGYKSPVQAMFIRLKYSF